MTANKEIKTIGVLTSGGEKRLKPRNQNEGDFKRIFRPAE